MNKTYSYFTTKYFKQIKLYLLLALQVSSPSLYISDGSAFPGGNTAEWPALVVLLLPFLVHSFAPQR